MTQLVAEVPEVIEKNEQAMIVFQFLQEMEQHQLQFQLQVIQ